MTASKADLRSHFQNVRMQLDESFRAQHAARIAQHFFASDFWQDHPRIAAYLPIRNEADPSLIIDRLQAMGRQVLLPRMEPRGFLRFYVSTGPTALKKGRFGILEPMGDVSHIPSLLLLPLLAYDTSGSRLGYGGGYYDRTLAHAEYQHSLRIGVAYQCQRTEILPKAPHDLYLHAALTEDGLEWFSGSSC